MVARAGGRVNGAHHNGVSGGFGGERCGAAAGRAESVVGGAGRRAKGGVAQATAVRRAARLPVLPGRAPARHAALERPSRALHRHVEEQEDVGVDGRVGDRHAADNGGHLYRHALVAAERVYHLEDVPR